MHLQLLFPDRQASVGWSYRKSTDKCHRSWYWWELFRSSVCAYCSSNRWILWFNKHSCDVYEQYFLLVVFSTVVYYFKLTFDYLQMLKLLNLQQEEIYACKCVYVYFNTETMSNNFNLKALSILLM